MKFLSHSAKDKKDSIRTPDLNTGSTSRLLSVAV